MNWAAGVDWQAYEQVTLALERTDADLRLAGHSHGLNFEDIEFDAYFQNEDHAQWAVPQPSRVQ